MYVVLALQGEWGGGDVCSSCTTAGGGGGGGKHVVLRYSWGWGKYVVLALQLG